MSIPIQRHAYVEWKVEMGWVYHVSESGRLLVLATDTEIYSLHSRYEPCGA